MLITDLLLKNAQLNPTNEAVIDGTQRVTYASLLGMSKNLAYKLQQQGFSPGNHAALILPRSIDYIIGYFAILFCGGVVVPIGVELQPAEVYSDLRYCDVSAIITSDPWNEKLDQVLNQGELPILKQIVLLNNIANNFHHHPNSDYDVRFVISSYYHQEECLEFCQPVERRDDDLALLLHTSGTTNNPKRVMLSHRNVIANVRSHITSLGLTSNDTVLIALPMHFGYCNTAQILTHLYMGGKLVLYPGRFMPAAFFSLVEREHITTFTGVPTMLLMLLAQISRNHYNLSSLRYICFGGGKMPEDKLRVLIEAFPNIGFVQTYGQTEASPRVTALLPEESLRKLGSVGKAIPDVQISVVNELGRCVDTTEIGEIVVNGPNVMLGYYKREEETRNVLISDGLHTGDLGYLDSEGYLYLIGRKKNIVICGGINVYPEEIEERLLSHPAIQEAIIVGEAHEFLGEIPVALVVCVPGVSISENELLLYCREQLTNYKLPRRIEFRNELAKTYNAKVRRFGQNKAVR